MTISFKRISRKLPVFFSLALIALSLVAILPAKHAFADNAVTQPLVWTSADHTNLVDAKNVVFTGIGWWCPQAGTVPIVKGSGGSFEIEGDVKPMDNGKTVSVPADSEAGSSSKNVDVPKCASGHAANYLWATSFPSGTNYALWTAGTGASDKADVDAQHKPIGPGQNSFARLDTIKNGTLKPGPQIKEIKVDTSKAGVVDAGKASNSDNTTPTDTCPVQTWGLRWIACPLFEAANTAINKLEAVVTSWLSNDVDGIFGGANACSKATSADNPSCAYYTAWNSFRVMAISLIIIAGIIMVVSEATGLGIFDAYTIRKILPRLLISVILISISWWLMKFVVQFFNNISIWVASLISYPFHAVTNSHVSSSHPWSIVGQWGVILAAIAVLGPFGILSYAGTIFLALAVGWITLVIRRMLIVFAIMSAPLFIACFIMPNTQKMGKFWRDGFFGLLLMGPIFTIAVTLGQITSAIASKGNNGDPFGIISFAALVIPIVSIPVLFSKIGGSVAGLVGFMNDKSKGGFDRLKNYRTNEIGRRKERAKSGELFGSGMVRGKAANWANSVTSNAALGAKGNFGMGAKGREAYDQRMALLSGQHAKSDAGQAGQFNDDMLRAQTYGDGASARRNMARDFNMYNDDGTEDTNRISTAINAAKANGGWGKARQVYAAKQLAVTGTGYDNSEQMMRTSARTSGGNESLLAQTIGEQRSASKRAGRSDLGGASFNDMYQTAVAESRALSGERDANGNLVHQAPSAEHYRELYVKAFQGTDGATLSRDKGASIKNITNALYSELNATNQRAQNATSEEDRQRHEVRAAALNEQIKGFQQTAGMYAAPAHNQTIHNNIVAPDRGTRRDDGSYTGPNIINQITQNSTAGTQQQVVYQRQADVHPDTGAETNVRYVQQVNTTTRPAAQPHMQESAEIFRSRRGGNGDINDPNLPDRD